MRLKLKALLEHQINLFGASQCKHLKLVKMTRQNIQGVDADRASGAKNRDAFFHDTSNQGKHDGNGQCGQQGV
jgi:hypothetical protein